MTDVAAGGVEADEIAARAEARLAPLAHARSCTRTDWLIDNAEAYAPLLESLRSARRSVHIAQLAFDADCAAYVHDASGISPARDALLVETLVDLASHTRADIRILLNASWLLNTARPLRKFFAARGIAPERIEVRGMNRFPHFMHAKLAIVDGREAFLLGSPFVNSYWDDGSHIPFDARRPLRELGGRPLHDVSLRLRGPVVREVEAMFASVWNANAPRQIGARRRRRPLTVPIARPNPDSGTRLVCDAPDDILPGAPKGSMNMMAELLAGIARARRFIYIEHQYLTSRPIAAALATALRLVPQLEIIIVLNQNPDLTAYRAWQNAQLAERALLSHPRVGVFSLWSTDAHPDRADVTRISQLFIHSKVMIVDDAWAAVGTSNLDGVSMGDYGDDFASALGRRVFRGVRNVEVNVVIDGQDAHDVSHGRHAPAVRAEEARTVVRLRERLWREHLGASRAGLHRRPENGWLPMWRAAAAQNVRALSSSAVSERMSGRVLPYSTRAFPSEQLHDVGVSLGDGSVELCYSPNWFSVHASPHWIRNIF
jgi:phosphatidylserine/phosphatidylglycerophosphate/cardiolipin synthase-like enzyme